MACALAVVLLAGLLVMPNGSAAQAAELPLPLVSYRFAEGSGTLVADTGTLGIDLEINEPDAVAWLDGGGLAVQSPTTITTSDASAMVEAVRASDEVTIEAWVLPAPGAQSGPARVVSGGADPYGRNFMLGQGAWARLPSDTWAARVRSTTTTNGEPTLFTPSGSVSGDLQHVVVSRAGDEVTLWVDGDLATTAVSTGSLDSWDPALPLTLANVADGSRPWLGTFCRVAIYDTAFDADSVSTAHGDPCVLGGQAPNEVPVLEIPADRTDAEGDIVSVPVVASDADGDQLDFSASGLPEGIGIDALSGLMSGSVSQNAASGSPYLVEITVRDPNGGEAEGSFSWSIDPVNLPPELVPIGDRVSTRGSRVSVGLQATDGDADTLVWSAAGLPEGLTVDADTGVISGTAAAVGSSEVTVTVLDGQGGSDAETFTWTVAEVTGPVPLVRYDFSEGSGATVGDTGSGSGLDLTIDDAQAVSWIPGGGLTIDEPAVITSGGGASDLVDAIEASGELTLEAWVRSSDTQQSGPARIVSGGADPYGRNVMLGQGGWGWLPKDTFAARVRSESTASGGEPTVFSPPGSVSGELQHVVLTRTAGGISLWLDGELVSSGSSSGGLSNWDRDLPLTLGNVGDGSRPWLGSFCRIAIFDVAVDAAWVADSRVAGCALGDAVPNSAPALLPPADRSDQEGAAVLVPLIGSDPDGDPVSWEASGLPDGLTIDPVSGVISGTVAQTAASSSPHDVLVTISDNRGGAATATFSWAIEAVNVAPSVEPLGDQQSGEGAPVSVPVNASDLDGDTLSYSATGLPDGLSIDAATGTIVGSAAADTASGSPYAVVVVVDDGQGGSGSVGFTWTVDPPAMATWWSNTHEFRVGISVTPPVPVEDRVAIVDLALPANGGQLDPDSLRLVEVDATGEVIDAAVPFQFDLADDFDPVDSPQGQVSLLLAGDTPAGAERRFLLYYDTSEGVEHRPAPVTPQVGPVEEVSDGGVAAYRVPTPSGTWYYDRAGGGFSSLVDAGGDDWIGFGPATGSAGQFRGIPSLVYPEGHFHPGSLTSLTEVEASGPLRTSLVSTTADGWQMRWDITPGAATATVLAAPEPYWFLYEGTPGGELEPATDTITRSDGTTTTLEQPWTGDLPGEEWVYFTDPADGRHLFVVSHDDDAATDSYQSLDGQMTVFGFGRDQLTSGLVGEQRSFTVGLTDAADPTAVLRSHSSQLGVDLDTPEQRPDDPSGPLARASADGVSGPAPLQVFFDASASTPTAGGTIVGHTWDFGDGSTGAGSEVQHTFEDPGVHVVELTIEDQLGATSTDHVAVLVTQAPVDESPTAVLTASPRSGPAPLDVTLDASGSSDPEGPVELSWSLGDGTTATGQSVSHRYTDPGSYLVMLTATDSAGQTDVAATVVRVANADSQRVTDGLLALYEFEEGAGQQVYDTSGAAAPLDLSISDPASVSWVPGGLRLERPTVVVSGAAGQSIVDGVAASDELTVEAWVETGDPDQNGPARIVTMSGGSSLRNFMVGQGVYGSSSDRIEARVRASGTNDNGEPPTRTDAGSFGEGLTHVVATRGADGSTAIYIDGALAGTGVAPGALDNWDDFRLALGNEIGAPRPWIGTYQLVAVYDRALDPAEVRSNYDAAPNGDGTLPNVEPQVVLTQDLTEGNAPLTVTFDASGSSDPDGSSLTHDWDFGDGSTGAGEVVTHEFTAPGVYWTTLTVTDTDGASVQERVSVVVRGDLPEPVAWTRLSTAAGDIDPPTTQPDQTVALVGDLSGDGVNDIVIGSRFGTDGPSVVWYERTATGWVLRVLEPEQLQVEAGGALHDIDGDGYTDVLIGEDSTGDTIYWWENPAPAIDGEWVRRVVKQGGATQHHDQAFGDVDGDGAAELVYWNNRATDSLFVADIPADPTVEPWPATPVFTPTQRSEGLAVADIDGDGVEDIVGGGYWFRHEGGSYVANAIEPGLPLTRVAVGDLIEGGRPEVVFDSGDEVGRLILFEWSEGAWSGRDLLGVDSRYGHSLNLGDINGDGHLDITSAEMALAADPVMRVLYGDGKGVFVTDELAVGVDNHESKLADLDGDGDLDILGKPFRRGVPGLDIWLNDGVQTLPLDQWQRRVVDGAVPWRTIFVDHADIDGDGDDDLLTGGWWWRNPGSVSGSWERNTIGAPLNQMAAIGDFDGDGDIDVIGTAAQGSEADSTLHWAQNDGTGNFTVRSNIDPAQGVFLQGATVAEFEPGVPEIALSWQNGDGGLQMVTPPSPDRVVTEQWSVRVVDPAVSGEGLDHGDIDSDGDVDIIDGGHWFRNDGAGVFTRLVVHEPVFGEPDRNILADMDADGDLDVVTGYGHDPEGKLAWYEQGPDIADPWIEHPIDQFAPAHAQSVDVADIDSDGDLDVVMGEHSNPLVPGLRAIVYENVGSDVWVPHEIHVGEEHHDGTQLVDLDGDGDLDVVSIGWLHRNLVIHENLAI